MDRTRGPLTSSPRKPTVAVSKQRAVEEVASSFTSGKPSTKKLTDWKRTEVRFWMADNNLEGQAFKRISTMNGEQLLCIYTVLGECETDSEFFKWAEKMYRFGCPEDLLKFKHAVKALASNV